MKTLLISLMFTLVYPCNETDPTVIYGYIPTPVSETVEIVRVLCSGDETIVDTAQTWPDGCYYSISLPRGDYYTVRPVPYDDFIFDPVSEDVRIPLEGE